MEFTNVGMVHFIILLSLSHVSRHGMFMLTMLARLTLLIW